MQRSAWNKNKDELKRRNDLCIAISACEWDRSKYSQCNLQILRLLSDKSPWYLKMLWSADWAEQEENWELSKHSGISAISSQDLSVSVSELTEAEYQNNINQENGACFFIFCLNCWQENTCKMQGCIQSDTYRLTEEPCLPSSYIWEQMSKEVKLMCHMDEIRDIFICIQWEIYPLFPMWYLNC